MSSLLFVALGILALSVLVLVHELGHFLAARWLGVRVEAFSVGWGPILFRFQAWDTEFRLSLLPLGGYCKMQGEEDLQRASQNGREWDTRPGSFFHVASWRRLVISFAGPAFNFLSALILLFLIGLTGSSSRDLPARVFIEDPAADTPANRAGLRTGDLIVAIDGAPVYTFDEVQAWVRGSGGRALVLQVRRDDRVLTLTVTPAYQEQAGRWLIGIAPYYEPVIAAVESGSPAERADLRPGDRILEFDGQRIRSWNQVVQELAKRRPEYTLRIDRGGEEVQTVLRPYLDAAGQLVLGWKLQLPVVERPALGPLEASAHAWGRAMAVLGGTWDSLMGLFRGKNLDRAVAGPIQTTYTLGQVAASSLAEESGPASILQLFSFLSLVLFLMNLLPIPGLDGGHILVSLWEIVRRRRLSPRAFLRFQKLGIVFIVGILFLAVVMDVFFVTGLR